MNPKTAFYLFKDRTPSLYHRTPLVSLGGDPAFKDYLELTNMVFGHQVAVYPEKNKNYTPAQEIANHFYTNCYHAPEGLCCQTEHGTQIRIDEFLMDTFVNPKSSMRNRTRYLLGEVGIGKTAFVNYLISRKFLQHVEDGDIWFLRADIEDYSQASLVDITAEQFLNRLATHAKDVFRKHPYLVSHEKVKPCYEAFLEHLPLRIPHSKDAFSFATPVAKTPGTEAFATLIRAIFTETGRRLAIIVDNVDKYIHQRDAHLFDTESSTGDELIIEEMIRCLLVFSHDMALGDIGANILFVSRRDTYDILCDLANGTSLQPSIAQPLKRDAFVILPVTLRNVIRSRMPLLQFAISKQPKQGREAQFTTITERINKELLDENSDLVETLFNLCNHGYRQLMDYFSRYGWSKHTADPTDDTVALARFTNDYPVGLISFMLGEVALYSQFISKFPNIYLIRMLPTAKESISKFEYAHTYWLKRLICEYLSAETTSTREGVLEIFSGNEDGFYSADLCTLALGSLSHADCSNTITATRVIHPHNSHKLRIGSIALSPRGSCLKKEIFDKFAYLQLLVDDYNLYLPRVISDFFPLATSEVKHYGYLVERGRIHVEHTKNMIRHKARQVLIFLEVLRHSLTIEERIYFRSFQRFRAIAPNGPPNVEHIRLGILNELVKISEANGNFLDISKFTSEATSKSESIRTQLESIYGLQ